MTGLKPVLRLPLDGDAKDYSGNNYHGINFGAQFVDGKFYRAAFFNGVDAYISVPDRPEFSKAGNPGLTVALWLCPTTLEFRKSVEEGVHFLGKGYPGQHEWAFNMYNKSHPTRPNRICFYVYNPEGGFGVGSYFQDTIEVGEWIHIVGVIDDSKTYIYKNGVLRDSDVYTGTITPRRGIAPVNIGHRDADDYFEGLIDEVQIYNRALTPEEVQTLYQTTPPPPPIDYTRLAVELAAALLGLVATGCVLRKLVKEISYS
jgi:hypothetical protein